MSKKLLFLLPLLTGAPLFLTGALHRPPAETIPVFVPQPVELAPDIAKAASRASDLFDRAVDRVSPAQISWLRVNLWQRMSNRDLAFESDGSLQLGPNDCARLDVTIRTAATSGRWLVVSDGRALAHVEQLGKQPATVTTQLLLPNDPSPDLPSPLIPADALRDRGCGGPHPLLRDLRGKMRETTVQTGLLRGRPVVQIRGRLDTSKASEEAITAVAADFCYVYLDAQTLWPGRLEWWGPGPKQVPHVLLEMEFRDPQVNRPLSHEQCVQAFSYSP